MPDNKDPSDTAGEAAANDIAPENTAAEDAAVLSPEEQSPADDSAVSDVDDPLEFGDQRMEGPEDEQQDEVSVLTRQLVEAESKVAEHWDRLLRLQAEMENQRKRAQNDVTKARKFALEGIVNDLLPVRDSLEMGIAAAMAEDADPKSIAEGADLTLKMLAQLFEKNNIVEINPVDEKFNPEFHQAMSMQEIEGKEPNTVTSVMQKGYTLNERLVRPALVMVSK
ncbi:MAG: nucleotide exchange factor GrpE [Granulosicoccus sp.]